MRTPLRVLIVEDREDDVLLILRELRRGGYDPVSERVATAEALRAALGGQAWDVVLSDYALPHFDGLTALRLLQESGLDLPFLLVSGAIGEETAVAAMKAGAHDYVMKDRLSRLAAAVRREVRDAEERRTRRRAEEEIRQLTASLEARIRERTAQLEAANRGLRESEERFRATFEQAAVGIAVVALDGRWLRVNRKLCDLVGYTHEELLGLTFQDLTHPADLDTDLAFVRQVLAAEIQTYSMEKRYFHKNGQVLWINLTVSLVREPSGEPSYFISVIEDIGARVRAEEALRESEARFRRAMVEAPVPLLIHDEDDHILHMSSGWTAYSGYTLADIKTISEWTHRAYGERRAVAKEYIDKLFDADQTVPNGEWTVTAKDGRSHVWEFFTTPIGKTSSGRRLLLSVAIDLTERKRAEAELRTLNLNLEQRVEERTAELRLQSEIAANMAEGVCLVRAADGTIVYTNPTFERMFGYEPGELHGLPVHVVNAPGERSREETAAAILGSLECSGAWHGEVANARKDGTRFWCRANVSTFEHARYGKVFIAVHTDITERVRAERVRAEHAAELARSNADLEQFAYVASHDLQEPLRMVASYMQLLADRYKGRLDDKADKYIGYAVDGATRMQALILDLLAYSRVGRKGESFGPVDAQTVVAQAVVNLQVVINQRGADVSAADLPPVWGNAGQLTQVFQNLIGNAVKFCEGRTPRIRIDAENRGHECLFAVRDNGIGIDPGQQERLFVLFQRLHPRARYPGTGIGLAICRKVVERHGGRIWVESQLGEGSVFYFTLPRGREHAHDEHRERQDG